MSSFDFKPEPFFLVKGLGGVFSRFFSVFAAMRSASAGLRSLVDELFTGGLTMTYRSPFSYLPDEHMRLVGIIAFHWETLDLAMQRAIAEVQMSSLEKLGLLIDNLSFRSKQDFLMSYARHLQTEDPPLWREFTQVMESVKKANTMRNTYVHAKWKEGENHDLPKRVVVNVRGGRFNLAEEPTPIADLELAAQSIIEAGEQFTTFFQKFDLMTS